MPSLRAVLQERIRVREAPDGHVPSVCSALPYARGDAVNRDDSAQCVLDQRRIHGAFTLSGWIKFWKDMADDPRLIESARLIADRYHLARKTSGGGGEDLSSGDALRFASNALRGALVTLWCYADEHIRNDDTLPLSSDTLDAFVGIEGFFDMIPRDWVTELDDGTVKLPGYCEKNGLIAKEKRASDNKARQAAWRARNNAKSNSVHTHSVTRNEPVTKCVDLDLDSDSKRRNSPSESKEMPRAARSALAFRLPPDFELTPERRAIAQTENANPEREFATFTDHWRSASGAKARKHDWDAAWRNWCRRAADFKPHINGRAAEAPKLTWRPPADEEDVDAPR